MPFVRFVATGARAVLWQHTQLWAEGDRPIRVCLKEKEGRVGKRGLYFPSSLPWQSFPFSSPPFLLLLYNDYNASHSFSLSLSTSPPLLRYNVPPLLPTIQGWRRKCCHCHGHIRSSRGGNGGVNINSSGVAIARPFLPSFCCLAPFLPSLIPFLVT